MSDLSRFWAMVLLASLLTACGSSPPARFYTLTDAARGEVSSLPNLDYGVAIGPVFVPELIDRPQWVLRMPGSEVRIAEQVRWAEPLKEGIARAVAVNVAQALNNGRVSIQTQLGTREPDYRVILDVQRFESALADGATLEIAWTVRRMKDGELQSGRARLNEAAGGADYQHLVTAHVRALAAVSRNIAEAIRVSRSNDVAAAQTGTPQ